MAQGLSAMLEEGRLISSPWGSWLAGWMEGVVAGRPGDLEGGDERGESGSFKKKKREKKRDRNVMQNISWVSNINFQRPFCLCFLSNHPDSRILP